MEIVSAHQVGLLDIFDTVLTKVCHRGDFLFFVTPFINICCCVLVFHVVTELWVIPTRNLQLEDFGKQTLSLSTHLPVFELLAYWLQVKDKYHMTKLR